MHTVVDAVWNGKDERPEPEHVFVLVDHAGCNGLLSQLNRFAQLPWISLFQDSTESAAIDVAPILIDLGNIRSPASGAKRLLSWLNEACRGSNALLVIRSTWPHDVLAKSLTRRLDALLPENMPVLLRYFDTRVFTSLMQVLDAQQKNDFLCPANQWWWLDRAGTVCEMSASEQDVDVLHGPIAFNAMQEARLIDSCEADAVALDIVRAAPDLSDSLSKAQLHDVVSNCLPAAHALGINSLQMQTLFCIVALEHGTAFHERAPWVNTLKVAQTMKHDFAWVIQQVEGTVQ